jgi:hypothetical protein
VPAWHATLPARSAALNTAPFKSGQVVYLVEPEWAWAQTPG